MKLSTSSKTFDNPTIGTISVELSNLTAPDQFLTLEDKDGSYIQALYTSNGSYRIEHRGGNYDFFYSRKRNLQSDIVLQIFMLFLQREPEWKTLTELVDSGAVRKRRSLYLNISCGIMLTSIMVIVIMYNKNVHWVVEYSQLFGWNNSDFHWNMVLLTLIALIPIHFSTLGSKISLYRRLDTAGTLFAGFAALGYYVIRLLLYIIKTITQWIQI